MPPPATPDDLLAWLGSLGARFEGVEARRIPGMGTGLVAARDLEAQAPLLFVPREAWLTRKTKHTELGELIHAAPDDLLAHSMSRVALLVALERTNARAWFRPYLDALGDPTVPGVLTPEERDAAQGLPIADWIDEQAHAFAEESTGLAAWLAETRPDLAARTPLTPERWAWAIGHVMQRTFSVDVEDEEVWVLVPGMDLCNHADEPNARFFAEDDGWYLEAARPLTAGEQVTIKYGRVKTSADLLLYYGFVTPDNANDRLQLRLTLADDDPDAPLKREALAPLGLTDTTLVDRSGVIPSAFLHAAVLWGLDHEAFHADAPDVTRPARAVEALRRIGAAVSRTLASFPTTIDEDRALLTCGNLDGWLPALVTYRLQAKLVHDAVMDAIARRIATIERDGWTPEDVVPEDPDGRHGIARVTVPIVP